MPVPNSVADLDPVAANNFPAGGESVGPNLDNYLRSHAAIIRQVSDAAAAALTAALPAGIIAIWSGTIASIPAGWQLADGTNGTVDLRDKFVFGAGPVTAVGTSGGAKTVTLSAAQMPVHNHGVNDPTHGHTLFDPGHTHGVNDPGHKHGSGNGLAFASNGGSGGIGSGTNANGFFNETDQRGTGISLNSSGVGLVINGGITGISIQNAGSGAAHENMPPYYALAFIQKV